MLNIFLEQISSMLQKDIALAILGEASIMPLHPKEKSNLESGRWLKDQYIGR